MAVQPQTQEKTTYTFRYLFEAYSKFGNARSDGSTITLTQSDKWMKAAGLFDGKTLTLTDTVETFFKFKRSTLDYRSYLEFLKKLCKSKKLDMDLVVKGMRDAGLPKIKTIEIPNAVYIPLLDKPIPKKGQT